MALLRICERAGLGDGTNTELSFEHTETGYPLKAGQSDPGSAGVFAGLRAWVTVNSRRGHRRSQGNPSAVSPQSIPA